MLRGLNRVKRIGIYAGVFDPVHTGHITTALLAIEEATLDQVVFLPERRPRHKHGVEHFGHRVAMLQRAVKPHAKLSVLELEDTSFSVNRTLLRLHKLFPGAELVFIWGSDKVSKIATWSDARVLFERTEFVIALRQGVTRTQIQAIIAQWPWQPRGLYIFDSFAGAISASIVREALRRRHKQPGLLPSVARYADQHWLYISFSA